MTADGAARILDRGYRKFEGRRSGVPGAMRSVAWYTTRAVLGLGRKARHKIAPVTVLVVAFLPAVIWVGATAIFGAEFFEGEVVPEFSEIPRQSIAAMLLFIGLVAPEALVRDRRDGMLSLYLSTPLTRITYLLSKVITVTAVLALITVLPTLLYLLGLTFASVGPDGFANWVEVLGRILLSGVAASLVYALISMAASSVTDRRAFASVAVIMTLFGVFTVVQILIEAADFSPNWRLLDPLNMPLELIERLFGAEGELPELSTWSVYLSNLGWAAGSSGLIWLRYRKAGA